MHCTSYARQASWLLAEVKRRQAPAPNIEGRDTVVLNDKHSSRPRPPVDELRKKAILVCLRNRILVDYDRMDMGEGTRNASSRSRVVAVINQVFLTPSSRTREKCRRICWQKAISVKQRARLLSSSVLSPGAARAVVVS